MANKDDADATSPSDIGPDNPLECHSAQVRERRYLWQLRTERAARCVSEKAFSERQEKLLAVIDTSMDAIVGIDSQGVISRWNSQAEQIFGWSRAEAVGRKLHETIVPRQYRALYVRQLERFAASGESPLPSPRSEMRASHRDGREFPIELAIAPFKTANQYEFFAFIRNISERKRAEQRKRWRNKVYELWNKGAPLPEILEAVVHSVERESPAMLCSILLLDGERKHLHIGAAPRLRDFYCDFPDGIVIGPGLGSCGATGGSRERVIVADMQNHADWATYRESAIRCSLVSCWLEPILSTSGTVLGSLTVFLRAARTPNRDDTAMIAHAARLAGVAIERHRAEEALQLATMVYQHSGEAMMVTDADNRIVAINRAYTSLTGYTSNEVVGKNPNLMRSGHQTKAFYQAMWLTLKATGRWQGEIWNRRKNGEEYAEWLSINTISNEDGLVHRYVAFFADITDKKRSDEVIWRQANYDLLTGLPNRRLFRDRLEMQTKKAHRTGHRMALLYIDLDHFKEINDALGDDAGDMLLIEAARRVRASVRESDTVARLGGDELIVLLAELDEASNVEHIAQKILLRLADPFQLGDEVAYLSASIGITLFPADATAPDDLLKNADQAMSEAKKDGRNRFSYYTSSMQEEAQTRLRLTTDLHDALAAGQLQVHFQPIVDLKTRRIHKAEALLRWTHPERGMISPAEFIPLAEESGLINDIGHWVFQESAKWAQRWSKQLGWSFEISVNKSPVQFLNPARHTAWPEYLKTIGLPGNCITVEITEGLLLNAATSVSEQLRHYRHAGIRVSIDDFGTGYSSMSYLKKFPVDYLKIDQSFVRDMVSNAGDRAIAETIIVMAHKLGLKVIAEGIETPDQQGLLAAAGCDFGQGYLFSKAIPPDKFEALLTIDQSSTASATTALASE